jgi:transmembrane sensor
MTHNPQLDAAALDWVIRQRDPAFTDWATFTQWLETSPAHARAYHDAMMLDADVGALPAKAAKATSAPLHQPRRITRRAWIGGALAASLVAIVSVGVLNRPSDTYRVETAMGETRTVTLADGTRIAVNGGSALVFSRSDARSATVERGQALFTVVHRADAPFRVAVGNAQLVDIGTIFDVTRADGHTSVAVSEGAVAYNPRGENVRLDAGQRLTAQDGGDEVQVARIDPASVGGWKAGQLVYDGVPLAQVTAEIERTTGVRIRTAPAAATIAFRGALQTGTAEAQMVSDLAVLSGTRASHTNEGWTLNR